MTQLMSIPTIIQMVKLLWQVRQEALSQDLDPRGKLAACCQSSSLKAMRACSHTREQIAEEQLRSEKCLDSTPMP